MIAVESRSVDGHPTIQHLVVTGEIDMWTVDSLEQALQREDAAGKQKATIIDLTGVTFIDSTGIGTLVAGARTYSGQGLAVAVVSTHPAVDRVLEITGVGEVIALHPDVESALRQVTSRG